MGFFNSVPQQPTYDQMIAMQIQQQQANSPPNAYYDLPQTRTESKFIEQLSPNDILLTIEMKIRKKYYISGEGVWKDIPNVKKPTEEAVVNIMVKCQSVINESTIYGNMPEDIIYNMTYSFAKVLSRDLALNYKRYNMELLDINKITHFCTDMCFIALKRGEQALTLRLLRTIVESKELVTQMNNPQESKASIWNPRTWGR